MKRPAFQFYPGDWRKDPALSTCSLAARGLWLEMMCLAHESEEYGVLSINGAPMLPQQIARAVGESPKMVAKLIAELERSGVFSRDERGCIYSRRMVKDERLRSIRADAGRLGGNPNLVRHLVNQKDKQTSDDPETGKDFSKDFLEKNPNKVLKEGPRSARDCAPHCSAEKDTQPIDPAGVETDQPLLQSADLVGHLVKQNGNQNPTPSSSSSTSRTLKPKTLNPKTLNPKAAHARARGEALQEALRGSVDGLQPAVWERWIRYRFEIGKPLKPASIPAAQRALARFGADQSAVVEQSIAQGWTGIFALKSGPRRPANDNLNAVDHGPGGLL